MKKILVLILLSLGLNLHAITWDVVGKGKNPIARGTILDTDLAQSAGALVESSMRQSPLLNFDGDETGIGQLNGLKSETTFSTEEKWVKAYGWCYSINGIVPNDYAHKVFFNAITDHLRWFYAYAYYFDGKWLAMCIPYNDPVFQKAF